MADRLGSFSSYFPGICSTLTTDCSSTPPAILTQSRSALSRSLLKTPTNGQ